MRVSLCLVILACAAAVNSIDLPSYHCAFHIDQFDSKADLGYLNERILEAYGYLRPIIGDEKVDRTLAKIFTLVKANMKRFAMKLARNWAEPGVADELNIIRSTSSGLHGLRNLTATLKNVDIKSLGDYVNIFDDLFQQHLSHLDADVATTFRGHLNGLVVKSMSRSGGKITDQDITSQHKNIPCGTIKYLRGWFGNPTRCANRENKISRAAYCQNGSNLIEETIEKQTPAIKLAVNEINSIIRNITNQRFVDQLFLHIYTRNPDSKQKWDEFFDREAEVLSRMYTIRIENACDYEEDKAILYTKLVNQSDEGLLNEFLDEWLNFMMAHTNVIFAHTAIQDSSAVKDLKQSGFFCQFKNLFFLSYPGCNAV